MSNDLDKLDLSGPAAIVTDDEDSIVDDYEYSFSELREFIDPCPKRGRVNRVLREKFFEKNDSGRWVRKNNAELYMSGSPSRPYWAIEVLPILIKLLETKYGGRYAVEPWVIEDSKILTQQ